PRSSCSPEPPRPHGTPGAPGDAAASRVVNPSISEQHPEPGPTESSAEPAAEPGPTEWGEGRVGVGPWEADTLVCPARPVRCGTRSCSMRAIAAMSWTGT